MTKAKILSRKYLQRTSTNVFTFGYGMPKDALDMFNTLGGSEYFVTAKGDVFQMLPDSFKRDSFIQIGHKSDFPKYF